MLSLGNGRARNLDMLEELVKTACGIANIGPQSYGAIFIGVADKEADKLRIEQLDGVRALAVGARHVVGVDRELPYLNISLEAYKRKIVDAFVNSGLSEPLKGAVLGTIDCIDYRGASVVCIWIPCQNAVSDVDDIVYVREGSSTKRVEGLRATNAVSARF
jgi:predicted HTH transcriptional regulator